MWEKGYGGNAIASQEHYSKIGKNLQAEIKRLTVPCLYSGMATVRLRCLPYFMLIGFPKCGTTDFAEKIRNHPDISWGVKKELYWWDHFRIEVNSSLSDYIDLFDIAANHMIDVQHSMSSSKLHMIDINKISSSKTIIGDFTSQTVLQNSFWKEDERNKLSGIPSFVTSADLKSILPNVKLIVMMRNPVSKLYSSYQQWRQIHTKSDDAFHNEPLKISPQDFHNRVQKSIIWWETCVKKNPEKVCLYGSPDNMPEVETKLSSWWPANQPYSGTIREGLYALYLEDWIHLFPKENFLYLRTEDYAADFVGTFNAKVFPFLNVSKFHPKTAHKISNMHIANKRTYENMMPETKKLLTEFYAPYNKKLSLMLGDDMWLWL